MEIAEKYRPNIIKVYRYWTLFLHEKQLPYVGRCYARLNDPYFGEGECMPFAGLLTEALLELQNISLDVTYACAALGYQTIPNGEKFLLDMAYLANEETHDRHMLMHFVPRSKVEFGLLEANLLVRDRQWGKNYAKPELGEHTLSEERFKIVKTKMVNTIVRS